MNLYGGETPGEVSTGAGEAWRSTIQRFDHLMLDLAFRQVTGILWVSPLLDGQFLGFFRAERSLPLGTFPPRLHGSPKEHLRVQRHHRHSWMDPGVGASGRLGEMLQLGQGVSRCGEGLETYRNSRFGGATGIELVP